VLDAFGGEDDLHARVRSALIGALKLDDDSGDAKLKSRLDSKRNLKQPVFILLDGAGLSTDVLERLRASELFAGVNFLVLTGEAGAPGLLPDEAVLKPLLKAGFEDKVWSTYEEICYAEFKLERA